MSTNGRRAWRAAAKKLRRKHGLRSASISCFAASNEDEKQENITGAWFKRHGFTMDDPRYKIRQYIGTWGTVDGDGVEFAIKPVPFTARSLVGMSQKARKRLRHDCLFGPNVAPTKLLLADSLTVQLHIGERLRPCPGCCACWPCNVSRIHLVRLCTSAYPRTICDGSGVLPARIKGDACLHRGGSR